MKSLKVLWSDVAKRFVDHSIPSFAMVVVTRSAVPSAWRGLDPAARVVELFVRVILLLEPIEIGRNRAQLVEHIETVFH